MECRASLKTNRKVKPLHLLSGTVSGREIPGLKDSSEVALLTGANSQCKITICHCYFSLLSKCKKRHPFSLYKTCARVQLKWPCLLCVQKTGRSKQISSASAPHIFKKRLPDWIHCFVGEAVSLYVLCAVVFWRQSICLFDQEHVLCEAKFFYFCAFEMPKELLSRRH